MNHEDIPGHEHIALIAQSRIGAVSQCACGALTLTLQHLSLRFDPAAFQDLQALLTRAQTHIDGAAHQPWASSPTSTNTPPVH